MVQKFRADEYLEILSSNLLIQIGLIFFSFYPIIGLKILRQFFLSKERFIVTSHSDISRYKENNADKHINFSATKEHKTQAI